MQKNKSQLNRYTAAMVATAQIAGFLFVQSY